MHGKPRRRACGILIHMKNPDLNYRLLMSGLILAFLGFAYWACAFHFFPNMLPAKEDVQQSDAVAQTRDDGGGGASTVSGTTSSRDIVEAIATSTAGAFTVIVMPDTQKYSRDNPAIFCEQTQWIADNARKLNIRFMSQLGDIVDSHDDSIAEWEAASKCLKILDDAKIPYGIIPGNHDTDKQYREDGMTFYDKYFPASRYSSNSWYGGNRKQNQNNYQIVEVAASAGVATSGATTRLLFLNLEIEPSDNTIAWANQVVKANPNTYTIVTTHKYLPDSDSGLRDMKREYSKSGNTGEDIWQKLVKDNCSIRMVWNGHYHQTDGESMLVSRNACGNDVHQIVQDYQEREVGGNGRLRIYEFDPFAKIIRIRTYSPYTKTFETDADSEFQIPFPISSSLSN